MSNAMRTVDNILPNRISFEIIKNNQFYYLVKGYLHGINYRKAKSWINEPTIDQVDRDEIKDLLKNDNMNELTERFTKT